MLRPRSGWRHAAVAFSAVTLMLASNACSRRSSGDSVPAASDSVPAARGSKTLVVDTAFVLKTADPGRVFEPTGQMVGKALYQTLLTFQGGDVTKPVPDLATYERSADGRTLTFHLRSDAKFSDGTPITADDVVFSLNRVTGLKANASFLLAGVTITKIDTSTVALFSEKPNPALPFILPSPPLSIVNAAVVKAHGGTTTPEDDAEKYLNTTSAGSGPYTLVSFNVNTQVVLAKNPRYTGGDAATFDKIVIRNVQAPTQKLNVQRGESQIALDLPSDQVQSLGDGVKLQSGISSDIVFLLLNQNTKISTTTTNPKFVEAVRKGIDYKSLLQIAGDGAVQTPGIIPSVFLGALPAASAPSRDLAAAKAALAQSGIKAPSVTLSYAGDMTFAGLSLQPFAERIQAQLKEVGIAVTLAPAPIATALDNYRNGKEEFALWFWGADYPDPSDYRAFLPGELIGVRAGWKADANLALGALGKNLASAVDDDSRKALYQQMQVQLNESGPFIPLMQPSRNIVTAKSLTGVVYNPVWILDVAAVTSK